MKTNAIVRIVIWSIVIVLLLGVLCNTLFDRNRNTFREEIFVFDRAEGSRTESEQVPVIRESSVNASDISKITIMWVAGDIDIRVKEGSDQIRFAENAGDCEFPMVYSQKGDELTIQFCKESFGLRNFGGDIRKDLVIEIPAEWHCRELELDVAAADLTVQELTAEEVDFDGAAGNCVFQDCRIGSLDVDAASGDISYTGSLKELDLDAASASFTGKFTDNPRVLNLDGMSAELDITLPADGGYTARMDGPSGSLSIVGHTTAVRNDAHIYGDGSCRISLDGLSCDLTIQLDGTPVVTP